MKLDNAFQKRIYDFYYVQNSSDLGIFDFSPIKKVC